MAQCISWFLMFWVLHRVLTIWFLAGAFDDPWDGILIVLNVCFSMQSSHFRKKEIVLFQAAGALRADFLHAVHPLQWAFLVFFQTPTYQSFLLLCIVAESRVCLWYTQEQSFAYLVSQRSPGSQNSDYSAAGGSVGLMLSVRLLGAWPHLEQSSGPSSRDHHFLPPVLQQTSHWIGDTLSHTSWSQKGHLTGSFSLCKLWRPLVFLLQCW